MKTFYEMLRILENEKDIDIPMYKDGEDVNRWQWKVIDLITQKRIANEQFVSIYTPIECKEKIKNFPNKNLLNEIMEVSNNILQGINENNKLDYIDKQIEKAYKLHFVSSFDCIKSSCNDRIIQMETNQKLTPKENQEILILPKKTFIFLSKWASVGRTFASISDSLAKASKGIDSLEDNDWQDFYYANKEVNSIFPILNNVIASCE